MTLRCWPTAIVVAALYLGCGGGGVRPDAAIDADEYACTAPLPQEDCCESCGASPDCDFACACRLGEWEVETCCKSPPPAALIVGCSCNPVAGTGCSYDEKCSWVIYCHDPYLGFTGCPTAGDKGIGEACTTPEFGADDCASLGICIDGVCARVCVASDHCPEGHVCERVDGIFSDTDDIGACLAEASVDAGVPDAATPARAATLANPRPVECDSDGQ